MDMALSTSFGTCEILEFGGTVVVASFAAFIIDTTWYYY